MTKGTIGTVIVIVLVVLVGFLIWNNNDGDLARDGAENTTSTEDLTGTGGADEGFDPLEGFDVEDDDTNENPEFIPEKG